MIKREGAPFLASCPLREVGLFSPTNFYSVILSGVIVREANDSAVEGPLVPPRHQQLREEFPPRLAIPALPDESEQAFQACFHWRRTIRLQPLRYDPSRFLRKRTGAHKYARPTLILPARIAFR